MGKVYRDGKIITPAHILGENLEDYIVEIELPENYTNSFMSEDKLHWMALGGKNIYEFNYKTKKFDLVYTLQKFNSVVVGYQFSPDIILLIGSHGVVRYNLNTKEFIEMGPMTSGHFATSLHSLYQTKYALIIPTSTKYDVLIDLDDNTLHYFSVSSSGPITNGFCLDNGNGNYLSVSKVGITEYNRITKSTRYIYEDILNGYLGSWNWLRCYDFTKAMGAAPPNNVAINNSNQVLVYPSLDTKSGILANTKCLLKFENNRYSLTQLTWPTSMTYYKLDNEYFCNTKTANEKISIYKINTNLDTLELLYESTEPFASNQFPTRIAKTPTNYVFWSYELPKMFTINISTHEYHEITVPPIKSQNYFQYLFRYMYSAINYKNELLCSGTPSIIYKLNEQEWRLDYLLGDETADWSNTYSYTVNIIYKDILYLSPSKNGSGGLYKYGLYKYDGILTKFASSVKDINLVKWGNEIFIAAKQISGLASFALLDYPDKQLTNYDGSYCIVDDGNKYYAAPLSCTSEGYDIDIESKTSEKNLDLQYTMYQLSKSPVICLSNINNRAMFSSKHNIFRSKYTYEALDLWKNQVPIVSKTNSHVYLWFIGKWYNREVVNED
jgi:hypothetical protein